MKREESILMKLRAEEERQHALRIAAIQRDSEEFALGTPLTHPIFFKVRNGDNAIFHRSKEYFHDPVGYALPAALEISDRDKKTSAEIHLEEQLFFEEHYLDHYSRRQAKDSYKLTTWVVIHSSLPGTHKLVAARIASHYNRKRGVSFPSIDTICEETGLSISTVQAAIKAMADSGEWEVTKAYADPRDFQHNEYRPLSPRPDSYFHGWAWVANKERFLDDLRKKEKTASKKRDNLQEQLKKANESLAQLHASGVETGMDEIRSMKQINRLKALMAQAGMEY